MNKHRRFVQFLGVAVLAPLGLAIFASAAQAEVTLPSRKPGFWVTTMYTSMKMTMDGQTVNEPGTDPTITAMCANAATDAAVMKQMMGGMGHCGSFNIALQGSDYVMNGSCANPMTEGESIVYKGIMTFSGDVAFHMVSDANGKGLSSHTVGDSKWIGACPAGAVPGDFGSYNNNVFAKRGNLLTHTHVAE